MSRAHDDVHSVKVTAKIHIPSLDLSLARIGER
uniref:Uncharacterized protein n=1 Tax=Arundo donax TaxID=35708 RepID=A0A0A9EW03_ARUDO